MTTAFEQSITSSLFEASCICKLKSGRLDMSFRSSSEYSLVQWDCHHMRMPQAGLSKRLACRRRGTMNVFCCVDIDAMKRGAP